MKPLPLPLAAALCLTAAAAARGELVNAIEAIVHDAVITYREVDVLNSQTYDELVRRYRAEPQVLRQKTDTMHGENLEKLIQRQLILHEFKSAGYSLPESVIDDIVREQIRSKFGDRAKMTKTLEEQGITYEKFRQQIKDRFIVDALISKNISSEIIVSPHKIEVYYLEHKESYKVEDQLKLRVIVLKATDSPNAPSPLKLGDEILAKLKEGVSFTEMASIYSQGSQRTQGGDWGWRELSKLTLGLADVARSVPVGKFSGLFSRSAGDDYWIYLYENGEPAIGKHYGVNTDTKKNYLIEERKFAAASAPTNLPPATEFYIMTVEDSRPGHYRPLSELREEIEQTLLDQERERLTKQWIDTLKKKTFVRQF
jgi:peptidyl-prolyl cis-trans isomerase SurA